jgi:hypothetical protein
VAHLRGRKVHETGPSLPDAESHALLRPEIIGRDVELVTDKYAQFNKRYVDAKKEARSNKAGFWKQILK